MNNVAVIPARSGSERVKNKNTRKIGNHPLLAYTVSFAQRLACFDRIVCTTDSEEIADIAYWYGVDEVILRPSEISTVTSPDIDWINHCLDSGLDISRYFFILRVTSPIKEEKSILRAFQNLKSEDGDSIRAIAKVREHPGKVWQKVDSQSSIIEPLISCEGLGEVAWHARQYQDLPTYYVQTSSFEIIKTRSIIENGTREGKKILGFEIFSPETITIDYEDDLVFLEGLINRGEVKLPQVNRMPYLYAGNSNG
jgi:CMP-N,N'-diacetyllegionaminic acid synthase